MENQLRRSPDCFYKVRVQKIRARLPKNIRSIVCEKHPEYNCLKGIALLNNVLTMKSSDVYLTEILEDIAQDYESK